MTHKEQRNISTRIMQRFISFFIKQGLILIVSCILFSIFFIGIKGVLADIPRNDSENRSVIQVVKYHQRTEPVPSSIKYISWSDVKLLDSGLYKVTVIFSCRNRFNRKLIKKQIILMDETGKIIKKMDCR